MEQKIGSESFLIAGNRVFAKRLMEENFARVHEARQKGATWDDIANRMFEPADYVWPGTLAKHYRAMCAGLGVRGVECVRRGGMKGRRWSRR